jgi:serine/threonine protein kinase
MASGPTRYGKYLLLEKLNGGGMSEVWRAASSGATHANLAIKRMLPNMATDKEIVAMFINEARIAAQLAHPNIAQVFDLGRIGDDFFIAMEYVGGADLRMVLGRSAEVGVPMPIPLVAYVAARSATRSTTPTARPASPASPGAGPPRHLAENCLVTFDGTRQAHRLRHRQGRPPGLADQGRRAQGQARLHEPEQVTGQGVDRRSDLFSLATVLYELVTGRQLFKAENEYMTVHALCRGRIAPPSEANPHVPEALDRWCQGALARPRPALPVGLGDGRRPARLPGRGAPGAGAAQLRKYMSVAFAPSCRWSGRGAPPGPGPTPRASSRTATCSRARRISPPPTPSSR